MDRSVLADPFPPQSVASGFNVFKQGFFLASGEGAYVTVQLGLYLLSAAVTMFLLFGTRWPLLASAASVLIQEMTWDNFKRTQVHT